MEMEPKRAWGALVARGVMAILFGVVTLAWPTGSLAALVLVFGAYAFADGVVSLMASLRVARAGERWWPMFFVGLVGIAVGVITFVHPVVTAFVLLYYIAGWAVVTGVLEDRRRGATAPRHHRRVAAIFAGAASIVFGILVALEPAAGMHAVAWLIGLYAILLGGMLIGLGLRMRGAARRQIAAPGLSGSSSTSGRRAADQWPAAAPQSSLGDGRGRSRGGSSGSAAGSSCRSPGGTPRRGRTSTAATISVTTGLPSCFVTRPRASTPRRPLAARRRGRRSPSDTACRDRRTARRPRAGSTLCQKMLEQLGVGDLRRVEGARCTDSAWPVLARRDLFVGRVLLGAAGVARDHRLARRARPRTRSPCTRSSRRRRSPRRARPPAPSAAPAEREQRQRRDQQRLT